MIGAGIGSPIGATLPFSTYRVHAEHTKEGQERLSAYYSALGRFVDMFSRVETAVTLTLWHYAETEQAHSKIIFSGTGVALGSTFIKKLAVASGASQEQRDDLKEILKQLGTINSARNAILHYGAESVAEGNAVVSNALKAKGEPNTFPISPDILNDMTSDLNKIIAHLNCLHLGKKSKYTIVGNPMNQDWRYKHTSNTKK